MRQCGISSSVCVCVCGGVFCLGLGDLARTEGKAEKGRGGGVSICRKSHKKGFLHYGRGAGEVF